MTKIPSRNPSGTYGHGPLKICFSKGKDDDHDQDFLKKDLLHIWSWSSDKSSSFIVACIKNSSPPPLMSGKSHPWTNTSVGGNFGRTFRTIGPYEFPQEKVWTNDWSIWISPGKDMDQWPSKFSESFGLDRHWSIECSSLWCNDSRNHYSRKYWGIYLP